MEVDPTFDSELLVAIHNYWNIHIHDLEITTLPVGTAGFFQELEEYRFDKLRYLPQIIDFSAYQGKRLLEVGCGVGLDLIRFARFGAIVTGIDLAEASIDLARRNFKQQELAANLQVMNGEDLIFEDNSFDMIYAHGVLQYTLTPKKMISEMHRVMRPGGEGIFMMYNRYSWMNILSKLMKVEFEHQDAPVFQKISQREFTQMLSAFSYIKIIPERFPVRTRLHRGVKASLYNHIFVDLFNMLPRKLVRPFGWHLLAFVKK